MTSFRIQVMYGSLSMIYKKLLQYSFNSLKGTNDLGDSFELFSYDSPIRGEGFQTSVQARSVLLKSENLCKRVNLLAGKLNSNQISQDELESLSSRVNLHIPRGSLTDTPLSPLSMGELDTDRISNKINEEEEQIAEFELLINVWKEWKNYFRRKKDSKIKNLLAGTFYAKKIKRKYFISIKNFFYHRQKANYKSTLSGGSYVQRILRKVILSMRERVNNAKSIKSLIKNTINHKLKMILWGWKKVSSELSRQTFKIRNFRKIQDNKVKKKYFKCFLIMSMIISREKQQRKIAESYNRDRLLRIGFNHISLSVFTNKFYQDLTATAVQHFKRAQKKKYLRLLYVKALTCKRIRIVNSTGAGMFRKNYLLKGMRRIYSFYSFRKTFKKKNTDAINYHTSNLYLKSFVSWQNYHNIKTLKALQKKKWLGQFKRKTYKKIFEQWKTCYPIMKRIRLTGEIIEKERKYWMIKEYLLEWTVLTKKKSASKLNFEKNARLRKEGSIFKLWKNYTEKRLQKNQILLRKSQQLMINVIHRLFNAMKRYSKDKQRDKDLSRRIISKRICKQFSRWRILFLRKITLTPLITKRYCKYIFRRWGTYIRKTSSAYKQIKKAELFSSIKFKLKCLSTWHGYYLNKKIKNLIFSKIKANRELNTKNKSLLSWKRVILDIQLNKLKIQKSEDHYSYKTKRKIFVSWVKYFKHESKNVSDLTRQWNAAMIKQYSIAKPLEIEEGPLPKSLEALQAFFLKSKGIATWYKYVKLRKQKSNDISSILSNSLNIQISDTYFKKESVQAIQDRRKKLAKKILAYWRQCVDKSKIKLKSALVFNKRIFMKTLRRILANWNSFMKSNRKRNKILAVKYKDLQEKSLFKIIKYWKQETQRSRLRKIQISKLTRKRILSLAGDLIVSWRRHTSYSRVLKKLSSNFSMIRRYKMIFSILKNNIANKETELEKTALNFRLSRVITGWLAFSESNRRNQNIKKKLMQKANDCYIDISHSRAIRRLHQHAKNRLLLKKADEFYLNKSLKKGINRWSSYYFKYLKIMKKAKSMSLERVEKMKGMCIKKWFYVSHLNSWKNRAERRLFFFWDRRLQRILFTWRTIVGRKYSNFEKVWVFRSRVLKIKTFKGLRMAIPIKNQKAGKQAKALVHYSYQKKKEAFRSLKLYHEYSRNKLSKLTKALQHLYYKTCTKILSALDCTTKQVRSKKSKVKKILNNYIRSYKFPKNDLNKPASYYSKQSENTQFSHINSFLNSRSIAFPKHKNTYMASLFLKWRSISGVNSLIRMVKSSDNYSKILKTKVFKNWKKALTLAKSRRKTLRSAIIYYRTKLKKKVFNSWKPKKLIKRRK